MRRPEPAPGVEEHHLGERLTAYLDGELGHDARERVQAHLATCPSCLVEVEQARSVKQLLTSTEPPGPSGLLMARLLAVAALPDDEPGPQDGPGAPPAEPVELRHPSLLTPPSLGGSRLTGGSFGRGPGSTFGSGALGADAPVPGVDPRAGRGGESQLWSRRREDGAAQRRRPATVLPLNRPGVPRGRRLVVAAAGAFSVAAVTLGGFGSLGLAAVAGDSPADEQQHGTAVNPQVPGNPLTAPLVVNFPLRSGGGHPYDLLTPGPVLDQLVNPVVNGRPPLP
ncbi:hypothetical protein C7C46_26235 [Streptomyces tateyamensis]|uniref:Putative zinc-finger domain-containing protein n=1 Tax=Streptomyces tateyamensis TaxID=565073 RepID=A0A2V4NW17_9ACTN|nr:hypothetical protein C7C46_26235 [Streptomyces tateyamensis]